MFRQSFDVRLVRLIRREVIGVFSHPRQEPAASDGGQQGPQPSFVFDRPPIAAELTNDLNPDRLNDVGRVEFGTKLVGDLSSDQGPQVGGIGGEQDARRFNVAAR